MTQKEHYLNWHDPTADEAINRASKPSRARRPKLITPQPSQHQVDQRIHNLRKQVVSIRNGTAPLELYPLYPQLVRQLRQLIKSRQQCNNPAIQQSLSFRGKSPENVTELGIR